MPRSDDEKIADELLALRLLAGYAVDDHGQEFTDYPTQNSPEEQQARAALARLVRDAMPGMAGELLALAIDPRTPSPSWASAFGEEEARRRMPPTRKIQFESPARGKSNNWARDLAVVHFIKEHMRQQRREHPDQKPKLGAAYQAASERYDLSPNQAQTIRRNYRKRTTTIPAWSTPSVAEIDAAAAGLVWDSDPNCKDPNCDTKGRWVPAGALVLRNGKWVTAGASK
jgi:hypothetical protein